MTRVLQVFNTLGNGGIEHFVMDRYGKIDKSQVQFDFLLTYNEKGYFDDEIRDMGGKIYYVGPMNRRPIKTFFQIRKIVKENKYDIVHRHSGNAIAYFDLRAARLGGAKHLILHSHNNSAGKKILHRISKKILAFDCIRFACSKSAGKWMFDDKSFTIIKNGIDVSKYAFSESQRLKIRTQYDVDDDFVIGHIGRFDFQKNHKFLVEIFKECKKINPHTKLMCVGDGFLKDEIQQLVDQFGLEDSVIFTGSINNVAEVINAFDVFCLPSLYEGLPITLVESQTNGLHCVVSKGRVTEDSNITGNITFVSLDAPAIQWATQICSITGKRSMAAPNKVKESGYDIDQSVKELQEFYLGLLK